MPSSDVVLLEVLGEHGRLVGVGAGVVERVAVLPGAAAGLSLAVVLEPDKRSERVKFSRFIIKTDWK